MSQQTVGCGQVLSGVQTELGEATLPAAQGVPGSAIEHAPVVVLQQT